MSVLQILLHEEPGGEGSKDDSNEGHSVGGDKFRYSGVVNSQIGQGFVNELCNNVEININPSTGNPYLDHIQQHQLLHRDGAEGGVCIRGERCEVCLSDRQLLELQIESDVHPHPALDF